MFQNMLPNIKNQDLLSIDIQRGRDVGVLTYVQVRELCGFKKISSFNDLNGVLSDKVNIFHCFCGRNDFIPREKGQLFNVQAHIGERKNSA